MELETKIGVLNHGYVILIDDQPLINGDLKVINAARASFGKKHETFDNSDEKLIDYLVKNRHDSPLRHVNISMYIKAPEFVLRQWYKHVVGIAYTPAREVDHAWNEKSGRYVEYEEEFYYPEVFRQQSKSNKQGTIHEEVEKAILAKSIYENTIKQSYDAYKQLLSYGVGKEIARTVLPLNFYTEVMWTASLQAILNFILLRDHDGAQEEIRVYAKAVRKLITQIAPTVLKAWETHRS